MSASVKTERHGRVLLARLDNPPHNFLDAALVAALDQLVRNADRDPGTGAVILTGAPAGTFIAHYDIAELLRGSAAFNLPLPRSLAALGLRLFALLARLPGAPALLRRTPAAGVLDMRLIHAVFRRMRRSGVVFIAALNGAATGGGGDLALACDLRIAAEGAGPFGQPEILFGVAPAGGSTQRLARMIGQAATARLLLEGRLLDPAEALELGLLDRVVPAAELIPAALATAERLARRDPAALALIKRSVYEGSSLPLEAGLRFEQSAYLSLAVAPAAKRAMRRYLDDLAEHGSPALTDPERSRRWQRGEAPDPDS